MVEEYGFLYYRAPGAGVALPIADDREVWLMEIFGGQGLDTRQRSSRRGVVRPADSGRRSRVQRQPEPDWNGGP